MLDPKEIVEREAIQMGRPCTLLSAEQITWKDIEAMMILYECETLTDDTGRMSDFHEVRLAIVSTDKGEVQNQTSLIAGTRFDGGF